MAFKEFDIIQFQTAFYDGSCLIIRWESGVEININMIGDRT